MSKKITAPVVQSMKSQGQKVVCLTAYDYTSGMIADQAGADLILVGDSLGSVIQGHTTTTCVTLEDVCYHTQITSNGVEHALLVADLPLGSYGGTIEQATLSAVELVRSGAEAVKLEGLFPQEIAAITKMGIPVMGHLGMTPQSVNVFGGHKVQGRGEAADRIVHQAQELELSGVFAIVLELVDSATAKRVSESVSVPTIGIGAGPHCDGQIQVFHDVVGLWPRTLKHAKKYANGRVSFVRGLKRYAKEVREGHFPSPENSF